MCPYCPSVCTRFGKTETGTQRYRCKGCKKTHLACYKYEACKAGVDRSIGNCVKEGCGIRSISRLLGISTTTVLRKIRRIAKAISKPLVLTGKEYEVDEVCTFVRKKSNQYWIVCALRRDTKEVVDFAIGSRTIATLRRVTDMLVLSNARMVHTDKLPHYRALLPASIHSCRRYGTNGIERKNLNLRTHIKRLGRRTICFSRSIVMLRACLAIYFWM